jgi:adenosylhomocysteinase
MSGLLYTDKKIGAYFSHLASVLGSNKDVSTVAIAHMVPNTVLFAPALNEITSLAGILPKPKSEGTKEHKVISSLYKTQGLSREIASDPISVLKRFKKFGLSSQDLVLVDIGGYFSESIDQIADQYDGKILGVLEGTENGIKRYEKKLPVKVPLITVARSPLKLPEDFLVGSSVVFSIEATLREYSEILQTRTATVVGYGRVGSAVAEVLRGRGISTFVYDNDPAKLAEAAARGFRACTRLGDALSHSTLVVCATGGTALDLQGFAMLRSGCVVASVTSADDELDLQSLEAGYNKTVLSRSITRYEENRPGGRHFSLIAGGNAANFLHGAVIGPAIQLIEGEKLAAISTLINRYQQLPTGQVLEVERDLRRTVAEVWNEHFL